MIQKAAAVGMVMGSFVMTTHPLTHHLLCRVFWWNIKSPRWLGPPYSPDLAHCDFCFFPKLKLPLKGKRFQTIDAIQENMTGQLMEIERTVWGPKVPTLKGTEASLSCVQCFLYLLSASGNVSIFHITWLDSFWTDLVCSPYLVRFGFLLHLSNLNSINIRFLLRRSVFHWNPSYYKHTSLLYQFSISPTRQHSCWFYNKSEILLAFTMATCALKEEKYIQIQSPALSLDTNVWTCSNLNKLYPRSGG